MALTEEERSLALRLARAAIADQFCRQGDADEAIQKTPPGEALNARLGLFVTLHKAGELRGCIGNFRSEKPLYENIKDMARAAAFKDPRFAPVQPHELPKIHIEISVLSPLREISDIEEITVGRHGIYIQDGHSHGVLLPQVAVENGFDRETFLDHTCLKAGLEPGCWRRGVSISVFEAEIFSEAE